MKIRGEPLFHEKDTNPVSIFSRLAPLTFLAPVLFLLMGMDTEKEAIEDVNEKPPFRDGPTTFPENNSQETVDSNTCEHEWVYMKRNFFSGKITAICSKCFLKNDNFYIT
ncbi:MAG: hypothetical protein AAB439_03005 [Patescibacteria group bacterium]